MNVISQLSRSVLAAALIIVISACLKWLTPSYISTEVSHRLLGMLFGAVVVFYSNAVPKVLASHTRLRRSPAADQAVRRFAGWSLVLGGLSYMLAWLMAPIRMANLIAAIVLATALLLAVLRCFWVGANASHT